MDLSELQREHDEWVKKNFPGENLEHRVLGMAEEVGELCHHLLKWRQGIRGNEDHHKEGMLDSLADLIIFGAGVATSLGADYGQLLQYTWEQVKKRDWQADPQSGRQKDGERYCDEATDSSHSSANGLG